MSERMVGRRVISKYYKESGTVIRWEPLSAAVCDVLVRLDDGREVWFGSSDLNPADDKGELPSRFAEINREQCKRFDQLKAIGERWSKRGNV